MWRRRNAVWQYVTQSKEVLVTAAGAELSLERYIANVSKKEKKENQLKKWKKKTLHEQFVREIECHNESKRWEWLREVDLERETESFLCGAQEQAIRTNLGNYSINKATETPVCRLFNENIESVTHIISACTNLAKNQYRKRYDKAAKTSIGYDDKSSS